MGSACCRLVSRGDLGIEVGDVFWAYYRCRANKRSTNNARVFDVDFETNLIELWRDINDGTYTPGRSGVCC